MLLEKYLSRHRKSWWVENAEVSASFFFHFDYDITCISPHSETICGLGLDICKPGHHFGKLRPSFCRSVHSLKY